jgi:streptomycin 6-kinase
MSEGVLSPPWLASMSQRPADGGPDGATWARALPRLLAQLLADWDLTPCGPIRTGYTAVVVPVQRGGERLALKIGWPHRESADEHLALRRWAGDGAVRLIAADPGRGALLLEALNPDHDLAEAPIDDACTVIGGLMRRLHVPAVPQLPRLSACTGDRLERALTGPPTVPRRYLEQTASLVRDLTAEPACDATLVHTDLHVANVLAGDREPWLAIDPKPMAGHPGYELQPVLCNRAEELGTGSALRWSLRRRVEIVCETAGIDEDTARAWTIVRATLDATSAGQDPAARSLAIAIVKAMND